MASEAPQAKRKTERPLISSVALNYHCSPTLPLSSWYSSQLSSFVKKAELAENCLQTQAVLVFSVKSTVFMRYHGLLTCILFFPENEQYKHLKFKEQFQTMTP